MKLQILGPIDLLTDTGRLDIGGPRLRIVLSMLAINVNRVTSVDQLVDAVWDENPPHTARGQIQFCISTLRKLLAEAGQPDAIKTAPPGYRLALGSDQLDSERFTELAAAAKEHADAGRTVEAAATLREALVLWRGPALAGVPSELVQRGADRLDALRLSVLEDRIRHDLALGRHARITGELRELCAEHALSETFYGLLMLALYRSGRQAEALEVCRRARDTLIEEIGIEPSRELRNLESAILNHAPELDLPAQPAAADAADAEIPPASAHQEPVEVPRQLPASIGDFTGREAQVEQIRQLLAAEPDPYAMPIVTISGKGGVGKSSLAIRVAHELADDFPDGHLYADMHAYRADDDPAFRILGRFLRALGVIGSMIPEDVEERAEMYRSRMAGRRVLVVLDDVVREDQMLSLLPGSPTCAVITTSRSRLDGLSGAHGVDVTELDVDQSVGLLAKIIGLDRARVEHDAVIKLVHVCDGLPLALRIAGARLASRPHWRVSGLVNRLADETRRLDELSHKGLALRSTIDVTYRALDHSAQRLFRLFALMQGPDFPGWTAAALLDTDLIDGEDVLERLVDAQMLGTVQYPGELVQRYQFHDLIRIFATEQLERRDTEQEQADALRRVLGAWLSLAERAHRKEYGGDFTIVHGSAPRWQRPDLDVDNPTGWWERERRSLVAAIKQAADSGYDELCWDLALTAVSLFETGGHFDDWKETAEYGLRVVEQAGNRRGTAAMLYSAGSLGMVQQRLGTAQRNFARALELFEADGDRHGCALVLRNTAYVLGLQGNPAMWSAYTRSLELMREVGDRIGEAHVLRAMAKHRIEDGDIDAAREMLEKALHICWAVRSKRSEAQVMHRFAELYLRTGEIEPARQALHEVLLIVRDRGDQIGEVYALYSLGILRFREGRLDSAETTLGHALELASRVGERLVEGQAHYTLGEVAIADGRIEEGAAHLKRASAIFAAVDSVPWRVKALNLLSDLNARTGRAGLAREDRVRPG